MGIVLYSPAHGETIDDHGAEIVFEVMTRKGHEVKFVELDWSETVDDWAKAVMRAYAQHDPAETEIVGMSLGSVATLVATTAMKEQPRRICLLSLSARWREDLPNLPAAHMKSFSEPQRRAFARLSFNELAPEVVCPTLLIMGSLEYPRLPSLAVRVHKAAELISNSTLVIAEEAGHGLHYPGYREALEKHL